MRVEIVLFSMSFKGRYGGLAGKYHMSYVFLCFGTGFFPIKTTKIAKSGRKEVIFR
jgi:hypothetical protein